MNGSQETIKSVHVVISGVVQGVGFRYWTERNAKELGLNGWVRNRLDGSVEALFSGSSASVDEMLSRCRAGPRYADVEAVEIFKEEEPIAPGFEIIRTG
jgi:acylphosphatase